MLIVYENSSFRDQTVAIFIVCTFYDCKKSASGLLQLCYPKLQLVQFVTWIIFRNPGSLSEDGGWSSPQEAWPASPRGAQAPGGWPASNRGPALEAVKQVAELIPPLRPFKKWVLSIRPAMGLGKIFYLCFFNKRLLIFVGAGARYWRQTIKYNLLLKLNGQMTQTCTKNGKFLRNYLILNVFAPSSTHILKCFSTWALRKIKYHGTC